MTSHNFPQWLKALIILYKKNIRFICFFHPVVHSVYSHLSVSLPTCLSVFPASCLSDAVLIWCFFFFCRAQCTFIWPGTVFTTLWCVRFKTQSDVFWKASAVTIKSTTTERKKERETKHREININRMLRKTEFNAFLTLMEKPFNHGQPIKFKSKSSVQCSFN